jgi:hypothetical protein
VFFALHDTQCYYYGYELRTLNYYRAAAGGAAGREQDSTLPSYLYSKRELLIVALRQILP